MLKVDQVVIIRHKVLNEGRPIREVARDMGVSRNTVRRYVRRPPDWKPKPVRRRSPKMELVGPRIEALLEEWSARTTKKQRLTGSRVHKQLLGEGYDVGITTVRTYLRRKRRAEAEVTIPLVHRPGAEGQVDFFDVTVDVAGERRAVHAFVMSLPYSDWDYAHLYEREDLPSFLDGHVRAFEHAGCVPRRMVYDNAKVAVDRIERGTRQLNTHFQQLVAHYAFETSFTRVGEGHDKGAIEVRGKRLRLDHLVPIPAGETLAEINAALLESLEAGARCRQNIEGRTAAERLVEEHAQALPLPTVAFDPRLPARVQLTGQSTVRLGGATYSVPSHWGAARSVMAWVGATDIRFEHGREQVLRPRERRGGKQIRYLHYLPQLARRPQAVRQVAPELVAELGRPWQHLWQLLVAAHDERRAGRVLAALLGAVVHHDAETLSTALQAVLSEGVHPRANGGADVTAVAARQLIAVPEHLAVYDVEAARATDYDPLLLGGGS